MTRSESAWVFDLPIHRALDRFIKRQSRALFAADGMLPSGNHPHANGLIPSSVSSLPLSYPSISISISIPSITAGSKRSVFCAEGRNRRQHRSWAEHHRVLRWHHRNIVLYIKGFPNYRCAVPTLDEVARSGKPVTCKGYRVTGPARIR